MIKYPHFISDKPLGKDCFDGRSQERLAHCICDYVRMADSVIDDEEKAAKDVKAALPRIIGLEGEWGSGKSNVVSMIGDELAKERYYNFTYDAWGHQEDLQRRSILETLTGKLITDEVLQGRVKIPMRNGRINEDTWNNQLSLLLSNKTTTIRKSTPLLTWAALWGVIIVALFAVLSHVTEIWGAQSTHPALFWTLDLIPVVLASVLAFIYWKRHKSFKGLLQMVAYNNTDTIDEEYTSSEEPSVSEFKNWMKAISDYLGSDNKRKYGKLIIVFDNMDRLPSEKVLQLWSSMYTFFAGGDFENIWAIIPYDYTHLCQAIYGSEENDKVKGMDTDRIKQFISKTFPITYHVPQPVITDYRKLFSTYFDEAFGPDIHDKEHICQVFMRLNDQPNPRTVIRFVNELVSMHLQWSDKKYRLQNQALYVLKKDFLYYQNEHLDTQLLSAELFDKVSSFYPDRDKVRTELCQYAYGLDDEKLAKELPLHNELKRLIAEGKSVKEYVKEPNFLSIFEKVMSNIDQASLDKAIASMASLDAAELTPEVKERIRAKWDSLANLKAESKYDSHRYDVNLTVLINHATTKRIIQLARSFASAMQGIKVKDGAAYFQAQHQLQLALQNAKVEFDDRRWYSPIQCEAEQFVQYVCAAKDLYSHYGLTTDVKSLNDYLLNGAISGNSQITVVVDYIKGDSKYDLSKLREELKTAIEQDSIRNNILVAAYINRVLAQDDDKQKEGILKVRFKKDTVASYLKGDQAPWAEELPTGLEDVMAMSLADGNDLMEIDDSMIPRISDCMNHYMNYTHLLQNTGKDGSAFRKLNVYCMVHQKGNYLDLKYAARHLYELQSVLGLEFSIILKHFNRWKPINWGEFNIENDYVKEVKSYVHQPLLKTYRDNPGSFSDSVIKLGVESLSLQNSGFLAQQNKVSQGYSVVNVLNIDAFWKDFVETFLGTDYIKEADVMLTNEAVTMLKWLYDHNEVKDPVLLNVILQHPDDVTLRSYLHSMMNDHLSKQDISKEKFLYYGKLLPKLGADMDANTARGLITHFIKPICKDAGCAAIIIEHKDFYLSVMRKDATIAASITKEMAELGEYASIDKELRDMVILKEEK